MRPGAAGLIYVGMDLRLDPRARRLLRTLISQHIRDGEPVGSRTLAKRSGLDVSPATIRNIMADLEEIGLVAAPHTSAGRVPTAQGYRVFVDSLLQMQPLQEPQLAELQPMVQEIFQGDQLLGYIKISLKQDTGFSAVSSAWRKASSLAGSTSRLTTGSSMVCSLKRSSRGKPCVGRNSPSTRKWV